MKAGRMDIAIHTLIAAFFLSHKIREDVKIHLIFYGMPDPPKHIEITASGELDLSKKDVAGLLKKILYKYKEGQRTEPLPGCFIEKKSLFKLVEELISDGKEIYVLDQEGDDIRAVKIKKNPVFLLGDQDGFPAKELKRLKESCVPVSIGKNIYFASHTMAIVQNELDRRGL
jgi:tRNA (pseudouridine54-N1)-methyltransferase